jgi:hypothetical protein
MFNCVAKRIKAKARYMRDDHWFGGGLHGFDMRGRESNYLKVDVGVIGERWNRWVEPARMTDGPPNE